jgi:hypothetical protein
MRPRTDRDELIATVAFALSQLRPLLRRIVAEKHPRPGDQFEPGTVAAERIVKQLELSGYEVRKKPPRRPHSTR